MTENHKFLTAFWLVLVCVVAHGEVKADFEPEPGTLTYVTRIKDRISSAKSYSNILCRDMEEHYGLMLDGDELLSNYISFYSNQFVCAKTDELKTVFIMRYVRGLSRRDDKLAEKLFSGIEKHLLGFCPDEQAYYELLLTYCDPDKNQREKDFLKAIASYEKIGGSSFELAALYNNYALMSEKIDKQRACEYYLKAIQQPNNGRRLYQYARNLVELMENDRQLIDRAFKSMDEFISKLDSSDDKLNVISSLIGSGFYFHHPRVQRKYMDIVTDCLVRATDKRIIADALLTLADREMKAKNSVDAVDLYNRCLTCVPTNSVGVLRLEVLFGAVRAQLDMHKMEAAHKLMRDLIDQTDRADIHDSRKAYMLALLAERCAECRDWNFFDEICQKSTKYDDGISLTSKLADVALDALNSKNNGVQVFLKVVEKATKAGIGKVDDDVRAMIEHSFRLMGNEQMAARWHVCLSAEVFSNLMKAESLLGAGSPESIDRAIEILRQMKPMAFKDGEHEYSQKDVERMILNDLLTAFVQKLDIGGCAETVRSIEELGETEGDIQSVNAINLGAAYIMLGDAKKGVAMLSEALYSQKGTSPGAMVGYLMLGKGYFILGDVERAIDSISKARNLAKSQGNKFVYVRASVDLAVLASTLKETDVPCNEILDEIIPLAEKESYVDDLARAYLSKMVLVMKNANVLRQTKLGQLNEIRQRALSSARAPLIFSAIFATSANLKHQNNFPAVDVLSDIEQYFNYSRLYLDAFSRNSIAFEAEEGMKVLLFEILAEIGDVGKIDYWNKVFERRKTRSVTMATTASQVDASFLSMMEQVSKYEAASEILKREQAKPEGSRDQTLLAKATEIKRELERNFDEAQKTLSPENAKRLRDLLADSFIIHPDSMGQLCSVLSDDVVCLQFLTVGEKIVVYLAAKGATPFVTTVQLKEKGLTERQLSSKVVKLRSKIQNGAAGKSLDQDLKALYDVLIADVRPVMDRLKCRRVIVNSSGMLRYVPFAALYDGDKYLVERYQISNVTGLDLIRLAKAEPNRSADSVRAMVFADPDGSLPSGRKEGERVAGLFKNSQLLVGDKASMANFESMLGNVNFIHLATHAVLDSGNPKNSFILFADGCQWRYCDMMGFCVENVDSIVLSACSTAVGEKSDGGEIEGMAYQLLRKSPSGSVLASFWKVDDAATEKLMGVYYNHISSAMREKGSLDRGGALHEAQLALLHNSDTASPYYWAAFSLFGDFR